jgi:protocatechuate 3,4-dioxygenase beta subunit
MSEHGARGSRRLAWSIGAGVLVATIGVVVWMLESDRRMLARLVPQQPAAAVPKNDVPRLDTMRQLDTGGAEPTLRGTVRGPDGEPVASASVSVLRLITSWPEWRCEPKPVDVALPGADGVFQFRLADLRGLLLHVAHASFADAWLEVPLHGEPLDVRLEPGFELSGVVTNGFGNTIPNARVAVESVPGDNRRADVRTTSANGGYRFTNLPAGPVRLVARHEDWQPASLPAVVVGDQGHVDLHFLHPASAPLKGRVVVAGTTTPLEGARVELLPLNGKPGLVDTQPVLTDKYGEFIIAGLARGSMRLIARHPDHGALMTTQTVGAPAPPLLLELPRRSLVTGKLDADGGAKPWRGGEHLMLRDSAGQLAFADLGADGSFAFPAAMSPGWANLALVDRQFAFQRSFAHEIDVRIEEALGTEIEQTAVAATRVRGRVVDDQGQPLAGASLMRTKPPDAKTLADAAVQLDLGTVGSQVAHLFASDREELLATTDKVGRFTIRGVKPGPLFVRVALRGYGSRLLRASVGEVGSELDVGDFALPRGARMQGVVLRGGRPYTGASVLIGGEGDDALQVSKVTDERGAWAVGDLTPGDYRVRARLPSQPAGKAAANRLVHTGSQPVVLTLDAGRTVSGEVLGSDGPVAGAIVSIVSVRGDAGVSVTSDVNGDFAIELPDRPVELLVALADRSSSRSVEVPMRNDRSERITVSLDTPPTCTIVATVAGLPGRQRLASAVLRLAQLDGAGEGEARSRWVDLPDGALRWPLCPTGSVRIEVWCEGYAPKVIVKDLAPNETHDLGELVLEPGCHLAGVVRRADGSPVAHALVMVGEESDLDLYEARTRTVEDGSFHVRGISNRSSRLIVRAAGFAARVVDLVLPRDVLAASPLAITLEEGASIDVQVAPQSAREGGFVQLRRDGRFVANVELGDDGKVVFANRSAGTYSVALLGDTRPPKAVVVEPNATLVHVQLP